MIYEMMGGPLDGSHYEIEDGQPICFIAQPLDMPALCMNADPGEPTAEFPVIEHAYVRHESLPFFIYSGERQR